MPDPVRFRLLAPSGEGLSAREIIAALALRDDGPGDRPRVIAVMVSAPDGRATVDGKSGGLSSPADSDVLRAMRAEADALFVGSRTLRVEGYGALLDEGHRAERQARGLPAALRLFTVARDLETLPLDEAPIFHEPGAPITVFTTSTVEDVPDPDVAAALEVVRLTHETLDLAAVLDHARSAHGADLVVTEGGPTLLWGLTVAGLLDDLLHTVAPMLIAGDGTTMLAGDAFAEPVPLRVAGTYQAGEHLFVHYRVAR